MARSAAGFLVFVEASRAVRWASVERDRLDARVGHQLREIIGIDVDRKGVDEIVISPHAAAGAASRRRQRRPGASLGANDHPLTTGLLLIRGGATLAVKHLVHALVHLAVEGGTRLVILGRRDPRGAEQHAEGRHRGDAGRSERSTDGSRTDRAHEQRLHVRECSHRQVQRRRGERLAPGHIGIAGTER
jgi:hypothetical protein